MENEEERQLKPLNVQCLNGIFVLRHKNDKVIVKSYMRKPFCFKMIKYSLLSLCGSEIPVEYRSPIERMAFERGCLQLWSEKGLLVPKIISMTDVTELCGQPSICIEHIEGHTLAEFLASEAPSHTKLKMIEALFRDIKDRHEIALYEQEHRLIHYDSNLRNLIIRSGEFVHIDFEMGHLKENIDRSASREVKKIVLAILNSLGPDSLEDVINALIANYGINHILRRMWEEELNRRFVNYHLKRDSKRKNKTRGLITKYDIAFELRRYFDTKTESVTGESIVSTVTQTSWDGKFYQPIDDKDRRGRNMEHRYQIMAFPKDFQGKSVLDIGCNIGRVCIDAKKRGAGRVVGLDSRGDVIDVMNNYWRGSGYNIELCTFDLDKGLDELRRLIGTKPFHFVCALSIWSHVDQQRLWEIINAYCSEGCWIEDNYPSRIKSLSAFSKILEDNLDFSEIEYQGMTTDRGVRPIFFLRK